MSESVERAFSAADYVVFALMLLLSAAIGLYYAIRSRRSSKGTEGFLLASRSMKPIPVAVSLTVSFQSAVTFLAIPAECYRYGAMYIWSALSVMLVAVVIANVFIPTFYSLRITSTCEYLERRFNKVVRIIVTIMFIVQNVFYLGINVYGPALALNGVTGLDMKMSMLTTGIVCTFYTALGGLRAVIWTDVFQAVFMACGLISFIARATLLLGWDETWRIANEGHRLDLLVFDTDPRIRYSFWTIMMGLGVLWLGVFGANQSQVQRYICINSEKNAKTAVYLSALGISFYTILASLCGVVMYSYYSRCDPLSQQCIDLADQLMPYTTMDIFRDVSGLPGMFLACVLAASLSTVSSGLNAIVTVTLEDFVKPYTSWNERTYLYFAKSFAIVFGLTVIGLAFLISVSGDIISVAIGVTGAFGGPAVALFMLGIWLPFINTAGATAGFISGVISAIAIFFAAKGFKKPNAFLRPLVVSTDGCTEICGYMDFKNATLMSYNFTWINESVVEQPTPGMSSLDNLRSISYLHFSPIGFAVTLFVGIVMSFLTCGWKTRFDVDKNLVRLPFNGPMCSWLPRRVRKFLNFGMEWQMEESRLEDADPKEINETFRTDTDHFMRKYEMDDVL